MFFSNRFYKPYLDSNLALMKNTPNKEQVLETMNSLVKDTLMETLNIKYVDADPLTGKLVATMPVDSRVYQPMGKSSRWCYCCTCRKRGFCCFSNA